MTIRIGDKVYADVFEWQEDDNRKREERPWYVKAWGTARFKVKSTRSYIRSTPSRIRNVYERARYGYGHRDLWNFDHYIAGVISAASLDLANIAHGWPQNDEFPTFESWVEWLIQLHYDLDGYNHDSFDEFGWKNWNRETADKFSEFDEKQIEKAQSAMERFSKYWMGMWD